MVVAWIVPGINVRFWPAAVTASIVIIGLNTFVKPIMLFLTWPLTIFSLGLFTLFINGLIFFIAARLVTGFEVSGVWTACLGALLMSIVNFILDIFFASHGKMGFKLYRNGNIDENNGEKRYNNVIDAEVKEKK